MKKALIAMVLTMGFVTTAALTYTRAFTTLGEDGFAVPASAGVAALLRADATDGVSLARVSYDDTVYASLTGYYVGQSRTEIDTAFPIYINDGAGLRFLDEEQWLVSSEVDLLRTYEGLYLNDGWNVAFGDEQHGNAEKFHCPCGGEFDGRK